MKPTQEPELTVDEIRDLLVEAGRPVSVAVVANWTGPQREAAIDWAVDKIFDEDIAPPTWLP